MLRFKAILLSLGFICFVATAEYHDGNHFEPTNLVEASRSLQGNDAFFEAFVEVEISWDNTIINDVMEIGAIVADSFKNDYNANAETFQDPLNRRIEIITVESASVTPQRFRKLIIGSATYLFKVSGSCQACPKNTNLFKNDAPSRKLARYLSSLSMESNNLRSESSLISSPSCIKKIHEVPKDFKFFLSFEIVSSEKTTKHLSFGETYEECAQGISEFSDQLKTDLSDKVNIVQLNEVINSSECMPSSQCSQGSICIANQCLESGYPMFALIWKGKEGYNLQVRAPDGETMSTRDQIPYTLWNVKVITFPSTGGPFGTYVINIEKENEQGSVSSPWDLIVFPGQKGDAATLIKRGIRSKKNIFFEFKNV